MVANSPSYPVGVLEAISCGIRSCPLTSTKCLSQECVKLFLYSLICIRLMEFPRLRFNTLKSTIITFAFFFFFLQHYFRYSWEGLRRLTLSVVPTGKKSMRFKSKERKGHESALRVQTTFWSWRVQALRYIFPVVLRRGETTTSASQMEAYLQAAPVKDFREYHDVMERSACQIADGGQDNVPDDTSPKCYVDASWIRTFEDRTRNSDCCGNGIHPHA
jgi:hypothetical protein